ncbi:hypothetical protein N9N67_06075 [Bacteriovoracaceae bacterium]|nr:hypothetical protein [Bacteriovoracaceae bacterium]
MNEIIDKLVIRLLFILFISCILFLYRYAHLLLYPSSKKQMTKNFYVSENESDTLHFFGRIIGLTLILSQMQFNEFQSLWINLLNFLTWSTASIIIYLLSIYLIESIILSNFVYDDEIIKRKNMSYSVVCFANSLSIAFLLKNLVQNSEKSLVILTILWLYSLVLLGLGTKLFKFVSKLPFNKLMIQKNLSLSFSYLGYILGITLILITSFDQDHSDLVSYCVQVLLKALLGCLIFPIVQFMIKRVFKLFVEDYSEEKEYKTKKTSHATKLQNDSFTFGQGIYEGSTYMATSLLTSIIIGQIYFGSIYPFF